MLLFFHYIYYLTSWEIIAFAGVGSSTMQLLNKMNIHTCADLFAVPLGLLQKEFGKKTGEMLYNMCRGIDNSKLNVEHVRKSVSAEVNYGIRFETGADADEFLRRLSREVCNRLQKANAKGRSLTLKLMVRAKDAPKEATKFMGHGVCDNFTKSKNLIAPVDDPTIITKWAKNNYHRRLFVTRYESNVCFSGKSSRCGIKCNNRPRIFEE